MVFFQNKKSLLLDLKLIIEHISFEYHYSQPRGFHLLVLMHLLVNVSCFDLDDNITLRTVPLNQLFESIGWTFEEAKYKTLAEIDNHFAGMMIDHSSNHLAQSYLHDIMWCYNLNEGVSIGEIMRRLSEGENMAAINQFYSQHPGVQNYMPGSTAPKTLADFCPKFWVALQRFYYTDMAKFGGEVLGVSKDEFMKLQIWSHGWAGSMMENYMERTFSQNTYHAGISVSSFVKMFFDDVLTDKTFEQVKLHLSAKDAQFENMTPLDMIHGLIQEPSIAKSTLQAIANIAPKESPFSSPFINATLSNLMLALNWKTSTDYENLKVADVLKGFVSKAKEIAAVMDKPLLFALPQGKSDVRDVFNYPLMALLSANLFPGVQEKFWRIHFGLRDDEVWFTTTPLNKLSSRRPEFLRLLKVRDLVMIQRTGDNTNAIRDSYMEGLRSIFHKTPTELAQRTMMNEYESLNFNMSVLGNKYFAAEDADIRTMFGQYGNVDKWLGTTYNQFLKEHGLSDDILSKQPKDVLRRMIMCKLLFFTTKSLSINENYHKNYPLFNIFTVRIEIPEIFCSMDTSNRETTNKQGRPGRSDKYSF